MKRLAAFFAFLLALTSLAHAQTQKSVDLGSTVALISTRDALVHFLKDTSDFNPLSKLSLHARARLLDTLIVNREGVISSFYVDDIRSELSPTDAYRVLALFGSQDIAAKVNNRTVKTAVDAAILVGGQPQNTTVDKAYCNGGYCTYNQHLTCKSGSCNP